MSRNPKRGAHCPSKHANVPTKMKATSAMSKEMHALRGQRTMLMRLVGALVVRNAAFVRGCPREEAIDSSESVEIPFTELNTALDIGLGVHRDHRGAVMRVMIAPRVALRSEPMDIERVAAAMIDEQEDRGPGTVVIEPIETSDAAGYGDSGETVEVGHHRLAAVEALIAERDSVQASPLLPRTQSA